MSMFSEMGGSPGYLKASFQGSQGSGKTYTAVELACGAYQHFKLDGPIACIDTEGGLSYRRRRIQELTGEIPIALNTRDFKQVMQGVRELEERGTKMVIIDSVTHLWNGLMESYKAGLAERFHKPIERVRLTIGDIGQLKDQWAPFAKWFISSRMHIIVCGRLGYDWGHIEDDQGNKELAKLGTKMKAEGEFGYESSLACEMELVQSGDPRFEDAVREGLVDGKRVKRVVLGTIIKDREDLIMGQQAFMPNYDFFAPVVRALDPARHVDVSAEVEAMDMRGDEADSYRRQKQIVLELLENDLVRTFPGSTGKDRTAKLNWLDAVAGTTSWAEITARSVNQLRELVDAMRLPLAGIRRGELELDAAIKLAQKALGPDDNALEQMDDLLGGSTPTSEPIPEEKPKKTVKKRSKKNPSKEQTDGSEAETVVQGVLPIADDEG